MNWQYLTHTGKKYWQYLGISFVIGIGYSFYTILTFFEELASRPYLVAQVLVSYTGFFIAFHVVARGMYKVNEHKIMSIKKQLLWIICISIVAPLPWLLIDFLFFQLAPRTFTFDDLMNIMYQLPTTNLSYQLMTIAGSYWGNFIVYLIVYVMIVSGRNYHKLKDINEKQELKILINQINPDFLYNTMDVIKRTIDVDAEQAADVVTQASELFRYNLTASKNNAATIEQELDSLTNYLNLLKLQNRAPQDIHIELADQHFIESLPTMTLIFMVSHILKNALHPNHSLLIKGQRQGEKYVLSLLHTSTKKRIVDADYFRNIKHRLAFMFHDTAQLTSVKDKNSHKLMLSLPLKEQTTTHPDILPSVI